MKYKVEELSKTFLLTFLVSLPWAMVLSVLSPEWDRTINDVGLFGTILFTSVFTSLYSFVVGLASTLFRFFTFFIDGRKYDIKYLIFSGLLSILLFFGYNIYFEKVYSGFLSIIFILFSVNTITNFVCFMITWFLPNKSREHDG